MDVLLFTDVLQCVDPMTMRDSDIVTNKFKKRVRARMKKTGESYQAARQALERRKSDAQVEEVIGAFMRGQPRAVAAKDDEGESEGGDDDPNVEDS